MSVLNYVELGDSAQQTILIIHGLFGSNKNWSRITKQLATHFHVIAVDCRNHGDSFNHPSMTYEDMSDDIFNLLNHLTIKKVILMGHSMGGKVAMQFSALHADYVEKLIVVDIAPIDYQHGYDDLIGPFKSIDLEQVTSRKAVDEQLKADIKNDFIRTFLMQSLARVDDEWFWKNNWENIDNNMSSIVASPTLENSQSVDTLFVFGEKSDYYSKAGMERVNQFYPDASVRVVKDGTHWLHYAQADEFLITINEFLG